jgi:tetratricopeptide (TPR) repeat protein
MDQVNQAERIVFGGQCTTDSSLEIRVSSLEMKMFGSKSEGGIVPRINRITATLSQNVSPPPSVGSSTTLKSAVSKTEMLEQPDGNAAPTDKAARERVLEQADHQIESGQTDNAKQALEQLTRQDYRNAGAYYALGNIALKNGDFAGALKNFYFAHFVQPSDPQYKIAVSECEQLINKKLNPHYHNYNLFPDKGDIHAVVNQGVRFWALGKPEEAKECFEYVLRIQAHNADAFYNLGVIADCKGDLPQALDFYKRSQYYAGAQINELKLFPGGNPISTLFGGIVHMAPAASLQELQATFDDANQAVAELKIRIATPGGNAPLLIVSEGTFPVCPVCRIYRKKRMYPD